MFCDTSLQKCHRQKMTYKYKCYMTTHNNNCNITFLVGKSSALSWDVFIFFYQKMKNNISHKITIIYIYIIALHIAALHFSISINSLSFCAFFSCNSANSACNILSSSYACTLLPLPVIYVQSSSIYLTYLPSPFPFWLITSTLQSHSS